jgi:hypothetical protein
VLREPIAGFDPPPRLNGYKSRRFGLVSPVLPVLFQVISRFPRVAWMTHGLKIGRIESRATCDQWHDVVDLRRCALLADLAHRMSAPNHQ